MSTTDTLQRARGARGRGDVQECLLLAAACVHEAQSVRAWDTAYWGAVVPGVLYQQRMEPSLALGHFRFALDLALRYGLTRRVASANHDLALAMLESGNCKGFKDRAAVAFTLYRDIDPGSPGISGLLADMAQAESDHDPRDRTKLAYSLQLWRAVPGSMADPRYRLVSAAQTMKAAASLGIRCRYEDASEHLDEYLRAMPSQEYVASILNEAARAALVAEDFVRAAEWAGEARRIATSRSEPVPHDVAGELLIAALAERAVRG